ncbi:hypothetical protein BGZ97_004312, partial [Linnemannia gamsii]
PSNNNLPPLPQVIRQQPGAPSAIEPYSDKDSTPLTSIALRSTSTPSTLDSDPKAAVAPVSPAAASGGRLNIFLQNIAVHSLKAPLPPPGVRLETTMQLAYFNQLLHTHLSPSLAAASFTAGLDSSQQASVNAFLQDKEEQKKVRELTIRVVEEFVADTLKSAEEIAEVVLLAPYLDQEYYRKLLSCFIAEFEAAKLLDIDLLQGLVQLVQCAKADYLQPDDLVRILVVLRIRLQDTHQQTTKHPYYLILALSRLLDVMVEGKVQDLKRVVDHEPLSTLLGQMMESADPYLKHQATYALHGLLHIPNDETRRQFVLRHAGNITMGLLEVVNVCKLDFGGLSEGAEKLRDATVNALEIGGKALSGAQSIYESGQGIAASVKGGILSRGRLLWYAALRETREHIHNGRLLDFNRLVFEAPCSREAEFQWGVCQLLGEIAIDPHWEATIRQHSVDFLAELYKSDTTKSANKEIGQCILSILHQVVVLPEAPLSNHAQLVLQGLEKEGDIGKQALYRDIKDDPANLYPLWTLTPTPASSPLLVRVLAIPDVEYSIHRLRSQRLKERENVLYIPPQAKPTLQSTDDTFFPLMEKNLDFLAGPGQVMLLLGDSGGGKSTFNLELEHTLWKAYKRGGAIPLHINLPAIDNPQQNMIAKQLQQLNFSDVQIQELKQHRQFIIICDGYDESQLKKNIYATNLINQPGQWTAKMVISCRSQYLGLDYRARFQPTGDRYQQPIAGLFQEAVIAPFSRTQIEQYVEQFVQKASAQVINPNLASWTAKDYMDKLNKIPKMIELVSNPFLLTLALRALPHVVRSNQDLSNIRLTRIGLYDSFIEEWLETNKLRLEASTLSVEAEETFEALLNEGFVQQGINYQKDLAAAIFHHQGGNPVVEYSQIRESKSWKGLFFGSDAQATLLRESSPLTRSGRQYRFLHRSILEYLYSRVMSDSLGSSQLSEYNGTGATESIESFLNHPLNQRSIVSEPLILQFLAERAELDPLFRLRLLIAVEESKVDVKTSQAAANAISILVMAGVRFNGSDLRGIRIPGADIHGGQFDSADMEGADLSNVNLSKAWLRQANLSGTQMGGAQFGQLPYVAVGADVMKCVFSSDGALLAVSTLKSEINVYNTMTWAKIAEHTGWCIMAISPTTRELAKSVHYNVEIVDIHTGKRRLLLAGHTGIVRTISYSLDGSVIATVSDDTTVRLWSTESGNSLHVLRDHTDCVYSVAFSPSGLHLVSCSEDKTVRTWDTKTGESLLLLERHVNHVASVSYSPDGHQIASADYGGIIILWDAHTGASIRDLAGHYKHIHCVAYSPDGHQLASCGIDMTIRLWDPRNGNLVAVLSGHNESVTSLSFSPKGDYIASGSLDRTVHLWEVGRGLLSTTSDITMDGLWHIDISPDGLRTVASNPDGSARLWETQSGKPGPILPSHSDGTHKVLFSPIGDRIASANREGTIRLWCARTGGSVHCFESHELSDLSFTLSPNGRQIATAGKDNTVRLWDAETGEPGLILGDHTDKINSLAYSPSGDRIASCSSDKTVRLWCSLTGEQLKLLFLQVAVLRLAFSPDGQGLVSLFRQNGTIRCWDSQSGELTDQLPSEGYYNLCCCFSPCGKLIATVGMEGLLRLWSRTSGNWSEVFRSTIGVSFDLRWRQGLNERMYLIATSFRDVSVWELRESVGSYYLQMLWRLGKNELSMVGTNMRGASGLSTANLALYGYFGMTELLWEMISVDLTKGTLEVQAVVDSLWNKRVREEFELEMNNIADKTNEASASSGTNFLMPRQKTRMVERTNVPAAALPLDHMLGQDSLHSTYVSGA